MGLHARIFYEGDYSMFVTVVAVMCKLIVAQPTIEPNGDCTAEEMKVVEVVTDSDKDPEHVDFFGCQLALGTGAFVKWKSEHPVYFKSAWRIGRVKCLPGHYEPPGRA